MGNNQLRNAYLALLFTFGLLLLVQWTYPFIPFLAPFKNSRFLTYYLQDTGSDTLVAPMDSSVMAQLDTTLDEELAADTTLLVINEAIFDNDSFVVPATANLQHLDPFFRALKKKKKKRIGYFGDSMIEGDLMTQTIREQLQKLFGGRGVGYVPLTSVTASFRSTITHTFSPSWKYLSLVNTKSSKYGYGISGETFLAQKDSLGNGNQWVKYSVPKNAGYDFNGAALFYGKGNGKGSLVANNKTISLNDTGIVNRVILSDTATRTLYVKFNIPGNLPLFGVSFESDSGLILDNFSSRGNSGMPLSRVSSASLSGFDAYLDYDLIVLQFGSNVVNAGMKDYHWYEKAMLKVINHYKASFPGSSILLVGLADKSIKKDTEMVTDPGHKRVLKLQYKMALKTGVAFWNLYDAMGGYNSMKSWVEKEKPPLANKDYTHFNHRGAQKAGELFYNFILEHYREFESRNIN